MGWFHLKRMPLINRTVLKMAPKLRITLEGRVWPLFLAREKENWRWKPVAFIFRCLATNLTYYANICMHMFVQRGAYTCSSCHVASSILYLVRPISHRSDYTYRPIHQWPSFSVEILKDKNISTEEFEEFESCMCWNIRRLFPKGILSLQCVVY